MPSCPSCSREVAESAAFCGYCGAAIGGPAPGVREPFAGAQPAPSYWICPQCSAENTADSQFCRACGAAQADPAAATVVTPPPFTSAPRWRCATCNELNDQGAQFCYYCGVPAGAASAAGAAAASSPRSYAPGGSTGGQGFPPAAGPPPPATRSWGGLLVLAAALIAVAAVGAAVAFVLLNDRGGVGPTPTPVPTVVITTSSPQSTPDGGATTAPAPDISAEMEAFLQEVEPLIQLSGEGMAELAQATAPSNPGPDAPDAIQYVIDNRTEVRQRLGTLTVPDDYQARSCRSAFKKAMTYALAADYHYLDWAYEQGDKGAATPDNLAAVDWKAEFVRIYNSLAAQYGNGMRHDWRPTDI